ncbi:A/G-specific adenine glycosylase [Mucilaginibacter sp. UR6-11]|uniref:A/G-specific adenine glycosylase n=1 Tax=Mucilaginibacter sp. UR6-11 TaxID=1435644 RepID=UPI001E510B3D|nr:A/G-specific adenine glycosylase [Mucilaginibacter sp. UR6-11]MCC8424473.1 A/G-specific adenine glycosylase [Mucilaginibacter sp. UR6-11]
MNFSDELVKWYHENKRDLPWRHTTDAYIIWLSEVILQQTRVEQGLPYFYQFAGAYPDVNSFAAATETDILKLWQGLGYYSRGRNMLKTAQMVRDGYGGKFPDKYNELIKLKGIGEYTAAAIASFSADEARAVVDGNVSRVIARYFGISEPINSTTGKKLFQATANDLLNKKNPGLHNQAMMEFGAMLCKPKNPACGICPVRLGCYAFKNNATTFLPVKINNVKIKQRFFNYFLFTNHDSILMNKRSESDIWANMYDLPLIETDSLLPLNEVLTLPETVAYFGREPEITAVTAIKKHVLTHQHLHIRFITIVKQPVRIKPNWVFIKVENLKKLPLSKVIFIFLDNFLN